MTKNKILCPECLILFSNKTEKNAIRAEGFKIKRIYFCSEKCKNEYLLRRKKMKRLGL